MKDQGDMVVGSKPSILQSEEFAALTTGLPQGRSILRVQGSPSTRSQWGGSVSLHRQEELLRWDSAPCGKQRTAFQDCRTHIMGYLCMERKGLRCFMEEQVLFMFTPIPGSQAMC